MSQLSEEQRLMRQSCRDFVDDVVIPFIRGNWQREWVMTPENRLPPEILVGADQIGIRTLGVPEEFGGIELEPGTEVQTFALISEEIARGDSGLSDKLVQNWKVSVLLRNLAPRHLQENWFKRLTERPAVPARPLPDRAARRLRPLAALQRAGSRDADPRGQAERRVDHQRPQAVHLQRLRRRSLRGLCQHQSEGRHAARHVVIPGAARHARAHRRALQRDAGLPVHEQRRTRVRGHARAGGSPSGRERRARPGRRLFPSRQDHPGVEEPWRRRARLRGHVRLRAELRAGRADSHQAPGGGAAPRRHGDPHRGGARAARARRARRRRQCTRRRHAVQHGQGVRVGGDHESGPARRGAAWRQRHDARLRRREAAPRRGHLPAHGRHRRHLQDEDRQVDVSRPLPANMPVRNRRFRVSASAGVRRGRAQTVSRRAPLRASCAGSRSRSASLHLSGDETAAAAVKMARRCRRAGRRS